MTYIPAHMRGDDPELERQRLTRLYADMSDGELEKIAADADSLTEVAQQTLESELARRASRCYELPRCCTNRHCGS